MANPFQRVRHLACGGESVLRIARQHPEDDTFQVRRHLLAGQAQRPRRSGELPSNDRAPGCSQRRGASQSSIS